MSHEEVYTSRRVNVSVRHPDRDARVLCLRLQAQIRGSRVADFQGGGQVVESRLQAVRSERGARRSVRAAEHQVGAVRASARVVGSSRRRRRLGDVLLTIRERVVGHGDRRRRRLQTAAPRPDDVSRRSPGLPVRR